MPKVTVYLTSYNHQEFISESIESILEQDFKDFELIIVDDCSTDKSWEVIKKYAKKDSRIKPFRNKKNENRLFAPQHLSQILGEYVALAHSDDKWLPGKLTKQVAFLDENPKYGACFTKVNIIDESGKPFNNPSHFYNSVFDVENRNRFEWLRYMLYYGNPFCHPSILIRKEMYYKEKQSPYGLVAIPDYFQWINLAMHYEIYVHPDKLTCFRIRDNEVNTSGESFDKRNRQAYELWRTLHLYKKIQNPTDLIAVFPETKTYLIDNEISVNFALGRILVDTGNTQMHRQLGLDILLECLNSEKEIIERLYGYTPHDYIVETGKEDLYGRIKPERFQNSRLYLDYGQGYCDENSLLCENYIFESGEFYVRFDFENDEKLSALRFDPDDRIFRKYYIDRILINGEKATWFPGISVSEGDWDVFHSLHAEYNIQTDGTPISYVEIYGKTQPLSLYDVDNFSFQEKMKIIEASEMLKSNIETLQHSHETLQHNHEALQHNHEILTSYLKNNKLKAIVKLILKKALPGSKS